MAYYNGKKVISLVKGGTNKLVEVNNQTVTEITASDLIGATTVKRYLFEGCTLLTKVELPNTITTIMGYAFDGCTGITKITIPSSVTRIYSGAFNDCDNLTEMTVLSTTPPTIANNVIPTNVTTIYVPAGTISDYQSAAYWGVHSSKFVELED